MHLYSELLLDAYKMGHADQYPVGTQRVVSNFTCRGSRLQGVDKAVFFGLQYYIKEYLMGEWLDFFSFGSPSKFAKRSKHILGVELMEKRLQDLKDLGHMPIEIRALPEGSHVPLRVPLFTIHNTEDDFYWLTNFLETQISASVWGPLTSATVAQRFRKNFDRYATLTGCVSPVQAFQGHDFSMRGMSSIETACLSAAGHALSFAGSDTVPVIDFLEYYYNAEPDNELIIGSVPATEHAVMCVGISVDGKEETTIKRLITQTYPKGIVSIVSDTFDFWEVVSKILPNLKADILARDGKVVIRPDSGDPFLIICGDPSASDPYVKDGLLLSLWKMFPGHVNVRGYKVLDPHIGIIYGDSITYEIQSRILAKMHTEGFASDNIFLGIGSYTYQYNTRDTLGCAIKATYAVVNNVEHNIHKNPKTDNGVKKSIKGLPLVSKVNDEYIVTDQATWSEFVSPENHLVPVYRNGDLLVNHTLSDIRKRNGF